MKKFIKSALRIKRHNFIILFSVVLFFSCMFSFSALADNIGDAFNGHLNVVAGPIGAGYNTEITGEDMIGFIINIAISFVGVVFLVLMIYGGYLWMTAAGNDQQTEKSKKLISAAIVGLIIVLAAYLISAWILTMVGEKTLVSPQ